MDKLTLITSLRKMHREKEGEIASVKRSRLNDTAKQTQTDELRLDQASLSRCIKIVEATMNATIKAS